MLTPFSCYRPARGSGPKLLLLGEAPGEDEEASGQPFTGPSGKLLRNHLLPDAGFAETDFHYLNVFSKRPPANELKAWTLNKTELKNEQKQGKAAASTLPQLNKRYLHPQHEVHLDRLRVELEALRPDLIIAVGGTALWALGGESKIGTFRGSFFRTTMDGAAKTAGLNCIATYHPASVMRQWEQYPIVWADLSKAKGRLDGTLAPPLARKLWINPTEQELEDVYQRFLEHGETLGVDIETAPSIAQITTVGFGTETEAICIPIWNKYSLPRLCHAHPDAGAEVRAWRWIERYAALPNRKVCQNGLYDTQYLLDAPVSIKLRNYTEDTAILQHALQPELPKALGTLASLYLNEPSWKWMRGAAKDEIGKADE